MRRRAIGCSAPGLPADQVDRLLARWRPDVALVQSGESLRMARGFVAAGIPTVVYLRDVEFHELGGDPAALPSLGYIANSQFVADRFKAAYGPKATVIRPLFRAARYATQVEPKQVTFVNPHPVKGADLAFAIAGLCPEIPFCFVEGWPMSAEEQSALEARVAAHPNIRLQPRTHDMRSVYGATRCLLVPSQWEEAWGRVVTEAQFSGIPAIGSNRGGLPEAIGPAGRVLPHDAPAEVWAEAVREFWADSAVYKEASAAAWSYGKRPEIDPQKQVESLVMTLNAFVTARQMAGQAVTAAKERRYLPGAESQAESRAGRSGAL